MNLRYSTSLMLVVATVIALVAVILMTALGWNPTLTLFAVGLLGIAFLVWGDRHAKRGEMRAQPRQQVD